MSTLKQMADSIREQEQFGGLSQVALIALVHHSLSNVDFAVTPAAKGTRYAVAIKVNDTRVLLLDIDKTSLTHFWCLVTDDYDMKQSPTHNLERLAKTAKGGYLQKHDELTSLVRDLLKVADWHFSHREESTFDIKESL